MESISNSRFLIRQILYTIGEDPDRIGLQGTPERVEKMWKEVFYGYERKNFPKISVFKNGSDGIIYDQMIIDSGEFYSHCEHHMVPFFGKYWFGYIPNPQGNIIGLSKIARVVDYYSARLQIQERLGQNIIDCFWNVLSEPFPIGAGLVLRAEHLCKSMRGVRKKGQMITTNLKGSFLEDQIVKEEFLQRINCLQ